MKVGVQLLQASLCNIRTRSRVLCWEWIGRTGCQNNVVSIDWLLTEDMNSSPFNLRNRSVNDLSIAQKIRIGHEN